MKVDCESCGKTLNIPDEKIPPNKKVTISCPACKAKVTVGKPAPEKKAPSPSEAEEQEEAMQVIDPGQFADEELEVLEEGAKRALICDTTNQKNIDPVLKELGYATKTVSSATDAIGRMKFTDYNLVVLAEDFAGSTLDNNIVLKYIQPMSMTTRRKMFVAMLGKDVRTMDNMKAFGLSVNVVISTKDMGNLAKILKKSISENDAFYKVFKETLVSLGKT